MKTWMQSENSKKLGASGSSTIAVNVEVCCGQAVTSEQREQKMRMQSERSKKPELTAAVKDEHQRHRDQYDVSREPLLNGLTSAFDLKLFRDAQMLACEQLVCD